MKKLITLVFIALFALLAYAYPCFSCKGTGVLLERCFFCKGTGNSRLTPQFDCVNCSGTGINSRICWSCDGRGQN